MKQTLYWLPLALILALFARLDLRADPLDNWTTIQVTTNYSAFDSIAYGSGRFVASAEYYDFEQFFSSEDGTNWILRDDVGGPWGTSVRYVNEALSESVVITRLPSRPTEPIGRSPFYPRMYKIAMATDLAILPTATVCM